MVAAETPVVKVPPLELLIRANHGYLEGFAEHRWGRYGHVGRAIRFTPSGIARLGQVFGWIEGLSHSRKEMAESLADNLITKLDSFSQYGGELDSHYRIPRYIIRLYDDGLMNNWSFTAHHAIAQERAMTLAEPNGGWIKDERIYAPYYWYCFSFNGGFIYHGPGADEPFAVRLGTSFWSTHT